MSPTKSAAVRSNEVIIATAYQSYPGWKHLIEPLVARATELGVNILQIKQKFGGLRFYVESNDDQLHRMIAQAEDASEEIPPR